MRTIMYNNERGQAWYGMTLHVTGVSEVRVLAVFPTPFLAVFGSLDGIGPISTS